MADFVTLGDLQAQVGQRADVTNALTAFPLTYLTEQINKGWRRLYGLLCETGEAYYQTQFTFTCVAAQQTYSTTANAGAPAGCNVLPLDLYKVRGLDAGNPSSNTYVPLRRSTFEERCDGSDNLSPFIWGFPGPAPRYDYTGSGNTASIYFTPAPIQAIPFRLWYFPVPPLLVNVGDQIDSGNGWDIYVVDWAARRCAEKDENYDLAGRLDASCSEMEQRIRVEAANRNSGQAGKVTRSRRNRHGSHGYGPSGF